MGSSIDFTPLEHFTPERVIMPSLWLFLLRGRTLRNANSTKEPREKSGESS